MGTTKLTSSKKVKGWLEKRQEGRDGERTRKRERERERDG